MWLLLKLKNVILFTRFHKSLGSVDLKGPDDWQKSGEQIFKMTNLLYAEFLATLVALHFTPVSEFQIAAV